MMIDHSYQIAPSSRFRVFGEEGIILRQDSGEVIAVNEVGAVILDLLAQGKTLGEVVHQLINSFEVDNEAAKRDALGFLNQLVDAGVVVKNPS